MNENNLKYLLYADPQWIVNSFIGMPTNKSVMRKEDFPGIIQTGMIQWVNAFDGDIGMPSLAQLRSYDIIHLNMPPSNFGKARFIKSFVGKDTKVVINIDHAIDLWHSTGYTRMDILLKEINAVDLTFCTESTASNSLEVFFDKTIPRIPHPVDLDGLSEIRFNKITDKKEKHIVVVGHRYDLNWLLPTMAVSKYKADSNESLLTTYIGALPDNPFDIYDSFDMVHPHMPFMDMMDYINSADVVIDTAITKSYGRVPCECAALGTPCISNDSNESGKTLFPSLNVDIKNVRSIYEAIGRILQPLQAMSIIRDSDLIIERYSNETLKDKMLGYLYDS